AIVGKATSHGPPEGRELKVDRTAACWRILPSYTARNGHGECRNCEERENTHTACRQPCEPAADADQVRALLRTNEKNWHHLDTGPVPQPFATPGPPLMCWNQKPSATCHIRGRVGTV